MEIFLSSISSFFLILLRALPTVSVVKPSMQEM